MKFLSRLLGRLSPVHIRFVLLQKGKFVGEDVLGNKYYRGKPREGYKRERRWVWYNGEPESSKVPPEWHGWLHYQTDDVPSEISQSYRREWQKPHKENLTGTDQAYRPPGHILARGKRDKATGDYQAWSPDNS